jgi:hypothetical protein
LNSRTLWRWLAKIFVFNFRGLYLLRARLYKITDGLVQNYRWACTNLPLLSRSAKQLLHQVLDGRRKQLPHQVLRGRRLPARFLGQLRY